MWEHKQRRKLRNKKGKSSKKVFLPGTHFTSESTEAMQIKCLAHGHDIQMQLGYEPLNAIS